MFVSRLHKGKGWRQRSQRMEPPAALNIMTSTPEGFSEITHMGREMSNLRGILGGVQLPMMLHLGAGVIRFGLRAGKD